MQPIQRAAARSVAGAAAYRGGRRIVDPRTQAEYDYTRRSGVAATHVIVPGAAIDVVDAQQLWGAVEMAHKRKDAVPAREIVVSLPHQLSAIRREKLTMAYAIGLSEQYGVAVDVASQHLADGLSKLQGLAVYAKSHGHAYRRIESVSMAKGTLRVLDLTREDVREAVASATDAASLFAGTLARDYT